MATFRDKDMRDFRITSQQKNSRSTDFNKIKVGNKVLANDVVATALLNKNRSLKFTKTDVEQAIEQRNIQTLRSISNFFFESSGIYSRLCRYMAYLFRYDWFVTPIVYDSKINTGKIIEGWYKSVVLLENSGLKKSFGDIALSVIKNGCYYGYLIKQPDAVFLQELPVNYCRSRYKLNGRPAVEFNIKYFETEFRDVNYRIRVLKLFPKEFQKAYIAYKNGNLVKDFQGDETGWFLLDPAMTVKFNLSNSDAPLFIPVIPAIIDLDDAKDLDKKKREQELLKVLIQKMPIDKNGDLIFDLDEVAELHRNAVEMLSQAIGIDVLTTFADVDVADLSDKSNASTVDKLESVERGVYNEAGVSQMQFNTDGNIALQKSIANDEATMRDLIFQFEEFLQFLLIPFNKNPKRLKYRVNMLPTTVYNYVDLSKLYKEQTQIGFSKLLPQVALGMDQSTIMATALFENGILNLDDLFIPPQMSSTISKKDSANGSETGQTQNKVGRPEKADDEKSTKTIQNIESQG